MSKVKKSGPAIFMYCVIAITAIVSTICFILNYGNIYKNTIVLWIGIVSFTIMYHLWTRIIMGNVVKLFKKHINYKQWWFKERKFEKRIYETLKVKKWKKKALTYNPELFSTKNYPLKEIANTMAKVEVDHWINEIISLSTLFFAIPWGAFPAFLISAIVAMIFDGQFIIIQRYNRPRVVKILERKNKRIVNNLNCENNVK